MAEAIVQVLLDNLSSLIQKEVGLIMGVDKEMKKLSSTLTTIQSVLADAEDKQLESESIRNWLYKLSDLAYEIDDLLDECATEVAILESKNSKLSLKKILFQRKIGRRMKGMAEKLDNIAAERQMFHLREMAIEKQTEVTVRHAKRETCSALNEPHGIYGRDEEKETIVDILVNRVKDCQQLSILPIIGLGGLGKTTLAQLVHNDQRLDEHFDLKLWVCVSTDFDPKTLVKAMIESVTGSGSASCLMHLDALQQRLWELLNKKRYLLILDDVWNRDQEKWAMLKSILACGSKGSSIVVTTRLQMVAAIMGTLPVHKLTELSEEHCWLLLKQRAFGQEIEDHANLEAIGRQIVKKCTDVPLAAKTLGGLLRFKRKEKEWIYVKESEIWDLPQKETSILPALRLSYRDLPSVLRRCFSYCATFPKHSTIDKEEVIYHWMAHGYISSNGMQEVEDVGDAVWDELVLRSLFQGVSRTLKGKITFTMHDLVHDLASSIIKNKFTVEQGESSYPSPPSKIRQVNLCEHVEMSSILMNCCHVRLLIACGTDLQYLPSEIGKLKQLRYLNLSWSSFRTLPNTICGLWNLQIVNLNGCKKLVSLPKNMRHLNNLRHLFLEECESLSQMPSKVGELTSLRTLSLFIVGHKIGNQLDELGRLNLGGQLEIRHLELVKNQTDARKANLCEKPNLRELILDWDSDCTSESQGTKDKMVLDALEPHPNIEVLRIHGFMGSSFPIWMANSTMANVIEIHIVKWPNCLYLPPLGDLPRLKKLILAGLDVKFIMEDEVRGANTIPNHHMRNMYDYPTQLILDTKQQL